MAVTDEPSPLDPAPWLEQRLEQELSDEAIWRIALSAPSPERHAALAARALTLYRATAPFLGDRARELEVHDTYVLGVLRGVADAHALESWDGWTEADRRDWVLPSRSLIVRAAVSHGVNIANVPAGVEYAENDAGDSPTEDTLDLFAEHVRNTLAFFPSIRASRTKLLDQQFLSRMRELSVRQLALARKWGAWASRVDDEPEFTEYAGIAIIVSQMFVVAALEPNGLEDLFPDSAWLVAHVEAARVLPWLALRGVAAPEWLLESSLE